MPVRLLTLTAVRWVVAPPLLVPALPTGSSHVDTSAARMSPKLPQLRHCAAAVIPAVCRKFAGSLLHDVQLLLWPPVLKDPTPHSTAAAPPDQPNPGRVLHADLLTKPPDTAFLYSAKSASHAALWVALATELQLVTMLVGQRVQGRGCTPHAMLLLASYEVLLHTSAVIKPLLL